MRQNPRTDMRTPLRTDPPKVFCTNIRQHPRTDTRKLDRTFYPRLVSGT